MDNLEEIAENGVRQFVRNRVLKEFKNFPRDTRYPNGLTAETAEKFATNIIEKMIKDFSEIAQDEYKIVIKQIIKLSELEK